MNRKLFIIGLWCLAFALPQHLSAQIAVTTTWEAQWHPWGGPNPAGLDTAILPFSPQRFGSVFPCDIDADGDMDFISGSNRGQLLLFQNTGTVTNPHWARKSGVIPSLDTIDIGHMQNTNEIRPSLIDIDADGDLDLFVGSRWNYVGLHKLDDIHFFRNTGTAQAAVFVYDTLPGLQFQQLGEFSFLCFGDLDNDGDYDFISGGSDSCTNFVNVGTATNPSFVRQFGTNSIFPPANWVEVSFLLPTPDLEDFDNDGDLDMYFMNEAGFIRYIPNNGTATVPDFSPYISYPAHSFDTVDFGAFGSMQFEDVNGDGVKDLMASHWNPTEWYWSKGINAGATVVMHPNDISCNGANDGYISTTITGGDTPYTYLWSNSSTIDSIGGLASGTYTITVTDSTGNVTVQSATINEPAVLVASATGTDITCNGAFDGTATVSPTGGTSPYTYLWSNSATTAITTGLLPGTYSVTVTDANGCSDTTSVSITEPTALVASAMATNVTCNTCTDGTATASETGGISPYSYIWSSGGTTAMISSLAAATYTVTITDANGCTDVASASVQAGPNVTVVIDSNVSCNGFFDGGATANATSGNMPYSYTWSNSATNASITGVLAGTYTVTVTDNNGLTATASGSVTEPTTLSLTSSTSDVSCNGLFDGSATATGTGGTSPYTYLWSTSATTSTASMLLAGSYTVTITDANGCTTTSSVAISEPTALVASASATNLTCATCTDGTAAASETGGTSPYTYSWNTGGTTAMISSLGAGTYSVTISDANGCTDSASTTVLSAPIPVVSTDSNVSCNGFFDGGLSVSVTGGATPYTYLWSNSGTFTSITGLLAGTYTITVTDNNGLSATTTGTVTEPAALTSTASTTANVSCNGGFDGSADVAVSGGTTPYTYLWSNSATMATTNFLSAGTFTVTITDANGCTTSDFTTVTEPTLLVSTAIVDSNVSCNAFSDGGGTASATGGTMPYSYTWSNSATTASITGVVAGTYSVTITDANGCTDSSSIVITEPTVLMASSTADSNVSCNGFSDAGATASATGGTGAYTYLWSNSATTASITGVTAGTYTVTITDNNGCTATSSVTLTEPTVLVASSVVDSNVTCNGFLDGGATASATGGTMPYSYLWNNSASTASITGVAAGTYTVTITDNNGCTSTSSVTISEPTVLVATTTVDSNVTCNSFLDGGASASATGGTMPYSYAWSNSATTASITGVAAGTYTVTITDNNGCTSTSSATITEPATLVASTSVTANVSCNGLSDGALSSSATGGTTPYTYSWSNSATTASITGVVAGTYTVTITDANGCTSTSSATVTEPLVLVAAAVVDSNVSCNGFSDGGATSSATGGTMPYTYNWSNAATTASITGVVAGTYSVTITDANGCTDSTSVTITEPPVLVASAMVDSTVSCNGGSDGGASSSATGGTMPYTYAWSNAAVTASITGVMAGTYSVTITDANGCTDSASVTISEPMPVVASTVVDINVSCNGLSDGGATASATGGTGAYGYLWSNSATTASITGVMAGTYSVTITDANGCTDSTSVTITEPDVLVVASAVDSNVSCNGFSDGGATASSMGGTTPYAYNWSNSAATSSITGVMAGTYQVTVTDANGCTDTTSVTITQPDSLTLAVTVDANVTCNGLTDGGASTAVTGGTTPYAYNWSDGSMMANLTGVGAGTYLVTVTDTNGCVIMDSVTITEPDALVASIDSVVDVTCEGDDDGMAFGSAMGGTQPYAWSWSNGDNTQDASNLTEGAVTLVVTDSNGCVDSANAAIDHQFDLPVVSLGPDTAVTVSAVVLTLPDLFNAYSWSTGGTDTTVTINENGPVWVMVTDSNGCSNSDTINVSLWPDGIPGVQREIAVKAYPNPTRDVLFLETEGLEDQTMNWTMMSLNGQVVLTGVAQPGVSSNRTVVRVDELPAGTYIIHLQTETASQTLRIAVY